MAQGPVHEAYADPVGGQPQPGAVIPQKPPDPIDELPPDQKPEGDNVQWIPGYWAWDDAQNNYLWVSGCWRVVPPGQQWVPGYWTQVQGGWQWTSGLWAPVAQQQVQYVPPPPASVDSGPSTPAPDATSTYVPGIWVYVQNRFLWRPGFWVPFRAGWEWVPACYQWTPAGCVFVDGYWDLPLTGRGLCFAPILVQPNVLVSGWSYTPQYCIQPDFLLGCLFVRPSHRHWYFGDYFGERFRREGFVPWVVYQPAPRTFSPSYAYYRHHFADSPGWDRGLRELYQGRLSGTIPPPPRTLVQQERAVQALTANRQGNAAIGRNINLSRLQGISALAPLAHMNRTPVTDLFGLAGAAGRERGVGRTVQLHAVNRDQRQQEHREVQQVRSVARHRHEAEGKLQTEGKALTRPSQAPHQVPYALPKRSAAQAPPKVNAPPRPAMPSHVGPSHPTAPGQSQHPGATPPRQPSTPARPEPTPRTAPQPKQPVPQAPQPPPHPPQPAPRPPQPAPHAQPAPKPPQAAPRPPQPAPHPQPPAAHPQPAPHPQPPPKAQPHPAPPQPKDKKDGPHK
jgi:hypothetical protein